MSLPTETPAGHRPTRLAWRWAKAPALVFSELFVALALTVCFFHLLKPLCEPKSNGDMFSATTFCYLSRTASLPQKVLMYAWRTRVLAPATSGWFLDTQIKEPIGSPSGKYGNLIELVKSREFQNVFGFYHAAWLFLSFLALIAFRKDALLLMLGIFAGLMYNLANPARAYCYPWDMSALFFFTLACLLFERGRIRLLLPVIVLGALFKETVLLCSLLVLLGGHWTWRKRIPAFLAVVAVSLGMNRLVLAHHGVHMPWFAMNNATTVSGLFQNTHVLENVQFLFSPSLNHVIFANAGALFLVLLLPWHNRREVVLKLLVLAFVTGQFLCGIIVEVRIWHELLPLGWMFISEAVARYVKGVPEPSARPPRLWLLSHWITLGTLAVIAVGTLAFAKLHTPATTSAKPGDAILPAMISAAQKGDATAQFKLAQTYHGKQDFTNAVHWLQAAAEQGHADAQVNLGIILTVDWPDYSRAAHWFSRAAATGHPGGQYRLGYFYWHGLAGQQDLVEAYKWLKLAQLQGVSAAERSLADCSARMTAEQIADAEKRVQEMVKANQQRR